MEILFIITDQEGVEVSRVTVYWRIPYCLVSQLGTGIYTSPDVSTMASMSSDPIPTTLKIR